MLNYVAEKNTCRSQLIAIYFGDNEVQPCGICDTCLQKAQKRLSSEEFTTIQQQLLQTLRENPVTVDALLEPFTGIKKEKAWRVLEFLQAENKIDVNEGGLISIR
jgi:ATP-dependent DNA helicase RecQ